jgi:hypothetical protein
MSLPPKAPPVYKPNSPRVAAPQIYQPQMGHQAAQSKPANTFRLERRPPPPVYRPQPVNSTGTQLKAAAKSQLESRPAPPVYRPHDSGGIALPAGLKSENKSLAGRPQSGLRPPPFSPPNSKQRSCTPANRGINPVQKLRALPHEKRDAAGHANDHSYASMNRKAPVAVFFGQSKPNQSCGCSRPSASACACSSSSSKLTITRKVVQPKLQIDKSCDQWKSKIEQAFDQAIADADAALGAIDGVKEGDRTYRKHFNKWFGGRKRKYASSRTKPSRIREVEEVFQGIADYLESRVAGDEGLQVECGGEECGLGTSAYSKHEQHKINFCMFGLAKSKDYLSHTIIHELTHILRDTTDYEGDDPGNTLREKALEGARPGVRKAASSAYNYEFFVEDMPDQS